MSFRHTRVQAISQRMSCGPAMGTKHPAQVKQMRSLGTRALAIVVAAFREPGWIRRIGLLFVVFGVPSLVAFLIGKYAPPVLHTPAQVIAGGVTLLVTTTFWMRSVYGRGRR